MKRILVYGMTSNKGGIEAYLMNYFRHMDKSRLMFDFVTDYPSMAYDEEATHLGSRIFYIPARRKGLFKHINGIRKIVKQGSYSTVYYNLLSASGVFSLLGLIFMRKVAKIVHSHNNCVKRMWLHRLCRPLLNLLATKKLACSKDAGEFMFGKTHVKKGRVLIVNNAIDLLPFKYDYEKDQAKRKELNLSNSFVIGHVGRMCHQKNSLFMLDIFNKVYEKDNSAVLLIIGEGEDRAAVEQKIEDLGLFSCVKLLGMRTDIPDLMQAMDVFLLPSRFEGFPLVAIEAQASGLSCIFADTFTHDVDVTGNVKFIRLEESLDFWSDALLSCKSGHARVDTSKKIADAGFDILKEAKNLEVFFTHQV